MDGLLAFTDRVFHDWLVLFSMVNAVGNLPIFAELTSAMDRPERNKTFRVAVLTAATVVLVFAFLGSWMLRYAFDVETAAFKIAGGILVFAVAARGMVIGPLRFGPQPQARSDNVAVFPLGFPFLAGPGTIVTTILLMQAKGPWLTALAAVMVYAAILPVLHLAPVIERAVGKMGINVVARILYIFIAAKAVAFVLQGIKAYFP
ncbi:MAG TPA: MarC family protein [Planctomycetota bacterium]|nr:MarC family protein [Planctomycetota bacterium]